MAETMPQTRKDALLIRSATQRKPLAKVLEPRRTFCENRALLGAILRRASEIAGMNRDQTADALQVNASSISRWWSGSETEPPQIWRYTSHPILRIAFLVAQAEAHQSGEQIVVETIVRILRATGTE